MNEEEDLLVLIDHIMAASWELLRQLGSLQLVSVLKTPMATPQRAVIPAARTSCT